MDKCKSKSCAKEECDVEYLFALNRAREREKERMRLRTYLIENVQEI